MLFTYVPSKPIALHFAWGIAVPGQADAGPSQARTRNGSWTASIYGSASMTLMLLAGVSGPLIDTYFLGGSLERRQIVATKAVCQIIGHGAKFVYFGGLIDQAAGLDPLMAGSAVIASMIGTSLARPILETAQRPAIQTLGIAHHHGHRRRVPCAGKLPSAVAVTASRPAVDGGADVRHKTRMRTRAPNLRLR